MSSKRLDELRRPFPAPFPSYLLGIDTESNGGDVDFLTWKKKYPFPKKEKDNVFRNLINKI